MVLVTFKNRKKLIFSLSAMRLIRTVSYHYQFKVDTLVTDHGPKPKYDDDNRHVKRGQAFF